MTPRTHPRRRRAAGADSAPGDGWARRRGAAGVDRDPGGRGGRPGGSGEAAGGPDRGGAGGLPVGRIWNRTDRPVLRLITCGGSFDRETGHYRDNIIVYAIT
jgi:hypothetical protein